MAPSFEGSLTHWRRKVDQGLTSLAQVKAFARTERKAQRELGRRARALERATTLAQGVAAKLQTQAHQQIADIVTRCLAIFDEPYEFRIDFQRLRGRTAARLVFERDGLVVDPLRAAGGGVVDVAAFALRVACLVLAQPQRRRLLVLDEPLKHLSAQYRPSAKELIENLARDLKIQFIIVTHDSALQVGHVVELE